MNVKLDENMPVRLVAVLTELGHETDTVPNEGAAGKDDEAVWGLACRAGRFLITQDLDFSDARRYAPGTHPGLLLVRLRFPSREEITKRVRSAFESEDVETWRQCLVVLTEHKIRVLRPD